MRKTRVCCKIYGQKVPKAYSDRSYIIYGFNFHVVIKFTDELLRKQQWGENWYILKNKQPNKINIRSETKSMKQNP
jgi:hypothetical protein